MDFSFFLKFSHQSLTEAAQAVFLIFNCLAGFFPGKPSSFCCLNGFDQGLFQLSQAGQSLLYFGSDFLYFFFKFSFVFLSPFSGGFQIFQPFCLTFCFAFCAGELSLKAEDPFLLFLEVFLLVPEIFSQG